MNVAGPSAVTIRRAIAKSGFSRNTDIQVCIVNFCDILVVFFSIYQYSNSG